MSKVGLETFLSVRAAVLVFTVQNLVSLQSLVSVSQVNMVSPKLIDIFCKDV